MPQAAARAGEAKIVRQQPGEIFRDQRHAEEIALADLASLAFEKVALHLRFDALRHKPIPMLRASEMMARMISASVDSRTSLRTNIWSILSLSTGKSRKIAESWRGRCRNRRWRS